MIRIALDANVLVSGIIGLVSPTSSTGEVLRRWETNQFQVVISDHILKEVERTLGKIYFRSRLSAIERDQFLGVLSSRAEVVELSVSVVGVASHAEDDLVLATAVSGQVEYLVTGDAGLLAVGRHRGVSIVTPSTFVSAVRRIRTSKH